jgi:hypothetical protein
MKMHENLTYGYTEAKNLTWATSDVVTRNPDPL